MTRDTIPGSAQRHGITGAIALALQLVLQHNGVPLEAATGIALGVATGIGTAIRWLIQRAG